MLRQVKAKEEVTDAMSKHYRKGALFENKIKSILEKNGYYVIRSAGSKGIFDLIAFPPKQSNDSVMGIQCKVSNRIKEAERQKLLEVSEQYGIHPYLATIFNKKPILIDLLTERVTVL